jgi:undecaprenyl-diphosphatase
MPFTQIIVLALIQGITEFLPISSSGHLILAPVVMGWHDQGLLTDMVTNVGTVTAVIIYFWRDVMRILRGTLDLAQREDTTDARLAFHIIIGSIPIFAVGLVMKLLHLDDLIRSPMLVAVNAIVFGLLLYAADAYGLFKRTMADMNWRAAAIIGTAQAFALSPGTSRSGVTMTAARALGFTRPEAARFSFLLSIPANGAASVLVIGDALKSGQPMTTDVIITGLLTFFVALGTISLLMRWVRSMSFLPFVIYRMVLGGAILGLIYSGTQLAAAP